MKAGVDHRVPLSSSAVAVIEHARLHSDGSDLIFSGSVQGKMMSDATMRKLINEIGFAVDVHGFRTSFKSWAVEKTNFSNQTSEAALAHMIRNASEAAYNRSDVFAKRKKLMEQWAIYLKDEQTKIINFIA
jgi:integrase